MNSHANPEKNAGLAATMRGMGLRARAAASALALASAERKHAALVSAASAIRVRADDILSANAEDLIEADAAGVTPAYRDGWRSTESGSRRSRMDFRMWRRSRTLWVR